MAALLCLLFLLRDSYLTHCSAYNFSINNLVSNLSKVICSMKYRMFIIFKYLNTINGISIALIISKEYKVQKQM